MQKEKEVNLLQRKVVKHIKEEKHFALDQEVGLVKEVKRLEEDGGVK